MRLVNTKAERKDAMKYQLMHHGWPVADKLIPAGQILDFSKPDDWTKLAGNRVPPMNACALDQQCADVMFDAYPQHRHLLHKQVPTLNVISNERKS